jgi:hypothetical protein
MSTDPARLTDDEREDLWRAYESWTEGDFSEHMGEAVEKMLPGRLAQAWDEGWAGVTSGPAPRAEHNPYRSAS